MRNKEKNFPPTSMKGEAEKGRAKAEYASKRANGTTNTHPRDRMMASNQRSLDGEE